MLSLLMLSLSLSTVAAAEVSAAPNQPLGVPSKPFVLVQPNGPMIIEDEEVVRPFDNVEIHPDRDTCYRIRAYLFTKGRNPQFLRETTCGPNPPTAKKMHGTKPGFIPLELRGKPEDETEQVIPVR